MVNIYIKRIKDLREDNDITQRELAEYLNITQQQYSLYEKGIRTIPVDLVIELARYYGVTTDYLLGLSGKKQNNINTKNNINIKQGNNNINNIKIK